MHSSRHHPCTPSIYSSRHYMCTLSIHSSRHHACTSSIHSSRHYPRTPSIHSSRHHAFTPSIHSSRYHPCTPSVHSSRWLTPSIYTEYTKNEAIVYFSFFKFLLKRICFYSCLWACLLVCARWMCRCPVRPESHTASSADTVTAGVSFLMQGLGTELRLLPKSRASSNCSHSPALHFLLFKLHLIYLWD